MDESQFRRICFAHAAYQLKEQFDLRADRTDNFQVRNVDDLKKNIADTDVLVISGLWRDEILDLAPRLRFVQSIAAGTDMFPGAELSERGIRLASGRGANTRAVAEHAIGHMLSATRRLAEARDNQAKHVWRGMIGDPASREDELSGKVALIIGIGGIGGRIALLAKAFDMHVIGIRRDPGKGCEHADAVRGLDALGELLPQADFVILSCPLTAETERFIDAAALARMKKSAFLINVARGRCVDEPALIEALAAGRIAGAGLDVTVEEPLPPASPLWDLPNVFITPHAGGETRRYENNILDLLEENLKRLRLGRTDLVNQVV